MERTQKTTVAELLNVLLEIVQRRIRGWDFGRDLICFSTNCNASRIQRIFAESALRQWKLWAEGRADSEELLNELNRKIAGLTMPGGIRAVHSNFIGATQAAWAKTSPAMVPDPELTQTTDQGLVN